MAEVEPDETPQPKRRGKKVTETPAETPVETLPPAAEPKHRGRPKKQVEAPETPAAPIETLPRAEPLPPAAPEAPPKRRFVRRVVVPQEPPEEATDESSSSPSPTPPPKRKGRTPKVTEAPAQAPPNGSLGDGSLGVDFWTKMLSHRKDLQENNSRNQYASFRIV